MNERATRCECGHELGVHDAVGCAAWLPAYGESVQAYCDCRRVHPRPEDEPALPDESTLV